MKNEIKEIEIFSQEQLEFLPQDTKDAVINLSSNLPQKELLVLNPLVSSLIQIQDLLKIEFIPLPEEASKEEKEKHKESIESFKSAKKIISAFKQSSAKAKKEIKGPLDALGKNVLVVEKSVNTIAEDILQKIELKFKPYIDAEAEKLRLAAEKKSEKEREAIRQLSEQNEEQSKLVRKGQVTTFLKYEMLENVKEEVKNGIENYSIEKLYKLRDEISLRTFDFDAKGVDTTLLEKDELSVIVVAYIGQLEDMTTNINNRIIAMEALKDNEKLIDRIETIEETVVPVPIPQNNTPFMRAVSTGEMLQAETPNLELGNPNIKEVTFSDNPYYVRFSLDPTLSLVENVSRAIAGCRDAIIMLNIEFKSTRPETIDNIEEYRRCTGAIKLMDKTILYIKNELPTNN